jgi:hypothetical protein
MRTRRGLCLLLVAALALGAGCQSQKSGRAQQRYRSQEYTFADLAARSEYVDRRTAELTGMGVSREEASARASREWFARAPAAKQVPTDYELQRRAAEAEITAYLEKRKEAGGR